MTQPLVLSLFPGIGMLDMAFEEEGFCVVRGPDVLWGGDIRRFNPPPGKFDGVIGGPPCQSHSTYAGINRKLGNSIAEDMLPEFVRVVEEVQPEFFVLENTPKVPDVRVLGYAIHRVTIDARQFGTEQSRVRAFQFGTRDGRRLDLGPSLVVFHHATTEPTCMASEGRAGRIYNRRVNGKQKSQYAPRRDWPRFLELQGLPPDFLEDLPFTIEGKYRVVGNGVPLPMGRAIARAVKAALSAPHPAPGCVGAGAEVGR